MKHYQNLITLRKKRIEMVGTLNTMKNIDSENTS